MKNNQDKEFKRWLKNKLSVTQALMIHFLITGSLSMFGLAALSLSSNVAYGALNDNGTGSTSSVAIGEGSVGDGDRSIAIGKNANTSSYESIAIGNDSKTTSNNNIAIGKGARSEGNNNSLALGNGAVATGRFGAIAIGRDTKAGGDDGIVLGRGAETTANESMALGYKAKAENTSAVALGSNSKAAGDNAIALGSLAETTLRESVALGYKAKATGNYALAIGRESKAAGNNGIVLGSLAETTANESMALGYRAKATASSGAAIGRESKAGGANSIALGSEAETTKDYAIALGYRSKATGNDGALAIGRDSKADGKNGIALGREAETTKDDTIALGYRAKAQYVSAVAIGKDATATGATSVALGRGSKAEGHDSYAIGFGSVSTGEKSMAFGNSSKARKINDIALGAGAETRDQGAGGYSIAIGVGAVSGSKDGVSNRNGNDSGGVAIGSGAYTGVNKNNLSSNSSVALGAGAGAGFRKLDASNMPVDNSTDVDTNVNVLKKAFGVKNIGDYQAIAGGTNGYTNVAINEATALGRNARAIGDQSVAIGAQTIAGMGSVALGGNDITQFANLKYYRSKKEDFDVTETVDHDTDAEISNDTISGTYKRLVGTRLDTVYKATYAQDGSVVLGVQSHSGTPLGTAIGTNALIRKGAFGATAIGAGSQVQANAEAAVAIGMGSVANGPYAIAAGTASRAELGDVAIGYQSEASGKEGAISIGQATKAKGDSSIMIGGANVVSASNQQTSFISEKQNSEGVRDTYTKDITETINNQQVIRRYSYVTLEDKTGTIADAYATLTGTTMNIQKLDYNQNKNGHASTSVGVHSLAKGDLASAFGASSRANAIGSLALGTGAQALVQNSVAIGTGSIAGDENYQNAGYDVTKSDPVIMGTRQLSVSYDKDGKIVSDSDTEHIVYTFKWAGGENTSPGDIVSFGKKGAERQLKHVAAGRIAENSTDAVNGSQLNAIIERFVGDKIKYFSVKSVAAGNHYNDGATGTDSIAIGPDATATATNTTATGNKSKASEENATAYGYNTEATGKSSVALGTSAIKPGATTLVTTEASGENSTALGVASKAKGQDSIALGYGVEAKNNFATAIGSEATVTADKGVAIGKKASVTVAGGIALGTDSVASVAGAQTGISMDGAVDGARTNVYTNLRDNAKTSGVNGAVSVGSPTATRQIVNLSAGTNDTDAVNVAQLKSVNLAFKGNTGTGDVRLHDQRLAVESSNTNLLTVEASDKKLTFTPKTATLSINNTEGSTTLGKVVAPTTDGLVKASELANTLNNMYWNVATSKNSDTGATHTGNTDPQPVKAGETVNFIAGEHVTIGQNGRDITISMKDALTKVELNKSIQQTFGNGKNTTLTTDKSGMRYSLNDDISLTTVTTGTTVVSNGKVTGLNDNLTNTENKVDPGTNKSEPVKKAELPNTSTAIDKKNAATVGDVLNAGWNLQNNGEAKDFVRTYDTVNFVDGINTKAVVTTDEEGKVSKVRYNVVGLPIKYTDDAGNPVTKVGDKYYKTDGAGNILDDDGNPVTKYDTTGNPLNANDTAVNPVNNVKTNLVNAKPEAGKKGTTDPTTLGNIKSGLDTIKNPDGTTTPDSANKTAGLVNLNTPNVSDNNAATVGDLRNMGWVVSAEGNSYNAQVKNANEVNFVGRNGLTVTGNTGADGVHTITIENSHSPITYTDENGNKLRKVGDDFYPENAVVNNGNVYEEGSVVIDGKVYPEGTTKDADGNIVKQDGSPAVVATPIANTPSDKVKATLNSVKPNTPTTLSNVGNNLKQVVDPNGTNPGSVKNPDGTDVLENGAPVTVTNKAPYTASEAADIVKKSGNNAATVGDVLNAGWNLQNNSEARDFVKPYDTVNFINGGNTTAVVTTDENGTTSNVTYNVTGLPVTYTNEDGKPVSKVGDNYYLVNDKGQPLQDNGNPVTKYDTNGNPLNDDETPVTKVDTTAKPLKTNLVNPNVATDKQTTTPTQLGNVKSGLDKITGAGNKATGLVNLGDNNVSANNVATVGDLRNMGWVVSSDKTTGDLGKDYNDKVRNANEVKFVGTGSATVSGKTEGNVRTITVDVNSQLGVNNSVTAVVYTKADGTKVYPKEVKNPDGTKEVKFYPNPDGTGTEIPKEDVITSVNGPKGTTTPSTLSNIASNLDGAKAGTKAQTTNAALPNTTDKAGNNYINPNNAATLGDVLNAGWNLQNNSEARDFVRPYDTVNFINGGNTTAVVTTNAEGTTSNVTYNVTGLPVTYTNEDGKPVSKVGDNYYLVNDKGQPLQDNGNPVTKYDTNGNPLNDDETPVTKVDTTAKPLKTNLVNPNVSNTTTEPNKQTTTPTQLGNVANGSGVYNNKVDDKGNPLTEVNGKYYTTDKFENGKLKENAVATESAKVVDSNKFKGLSNLTNAPDSNVATVGDIKNLGWVVSSDKTTGALGTEYNDQVRNANEVKFVGTGTATVSGKTVDGVRTITVEVNDQVSTNNSKLPVVYTITEKNGENTSNKQVYPNKVPEIGTDGNPVKNSDGTVKMIDGFTTTPEGVTVKADGTIDPGEKAKIVDSKTTPINTSINGVDGTDKATTLSNVLGNLPQVNDKDKTVNRPDGKVYTKDGKAVTGNTKSPITAEEAVDIVKKSGNNAATVGDVLNAGWNLQGNGKALDFVKPYDTVNFVDGIGTTVEAKVDEKGTTSTIKINTVMQYTDKEGNPVKKAENGKYYKESDLAGKVYDKANDKFINADGSELTEQPKAVNNPQVTIVNAEPANNKTATTTPTQLGNVANGSETYAAPVVNGEKVVQAKDGKWYKETDVVNGTANKNATAVTTPINPGKSGLVDFSKSNLTNVATVGDLQNLGWVVSSDKTTGNLGTEYNDQVRNANEVKFVGKNGIQVSGKTDDRGVRTLTFEMETGEITPTEIVKPDDNKLDKKVVTIGNKVYNAEDIDTNGKPKKDAVPVGTIVDGKVYADKDLNADGKPNDSASPIAKVKENVGAKFVTGNQVADAIEKSGFIVGKNQGLRESDFENKDEKINPNDELRFADGRNTNVKLATKDVIDATGKVKTVTTVKVDVVDLPITYTDESGKVVVKGKDGKFYYPEALDGKVYDEKEKTYKNPDGTALAKQPEAKENIQANLVNPNVSNTDTEPNKQTTTPTQLGNIANGANTFAKEGKQIANDGKWYNEGDVLPNGKPKENVTAVEKPENVGKSGLIDFEKSKPNNAATVGDLQNLGWVVSSDKTTGNTSKPYNDQVRNSNEVKFVGKNGIQVSGKTDDKGVRTLTFEMETGEITPTEITKPDGTKLVKVGDKAYNPGDIGTNGQPKDGAKPVGTIAKDGNVYNVSDVDDKGNVITQTGKPAPTPIATNTPNNGTKVVTGNQVADALEKSGFVVGKNNNELSAADFKNEDEKVNPNDELRFADGKNTNVKLATKEVVDASGKVKTVTTVKVDVEELPITYTDKAGNPIVKKDGKFYLLDDKGNATNTEVKVEDIKTNLVAPNSKPNEIGTPQSLGNVASGLKATDIKTDANKSDDKEVVKALITTTEDDKKLNTVANLDDLKTLSKAGLDFGANFGKDVHKNLGEKLSILGNTEVVEKDANDEAKFSSKNVVTTTDTDKGTVNIKFSQNPDFDSIKIGNRNNRPVVTMSSEGIDAGNTKITNVAPGEISDTSQDAINGSQLNTAIKGINAGIASSVAMANLPQVSNIGMHRHNIAAAIGIHRGETAIALGLSGLNHRGSLVYKASGALNTKGHVTFGVGLGYQFDRNTRDNDTHRNDIIDLKEKLEDVIRENSEYKQEIQEYRKEQEQNKAIIEQLMKRLEALEKTK